MLIGIISLLTGCRFGEFNDKKKVPDDFFDKEIYMDDVHKC